MYILCYFSLKGSWEYWDLFVVSMNASSCKLYCTEMVGRVADRAVQIHGGAGYISEYCVERFYRDVRLFRLYEGTSQIQQLVIAKQMIRNTGSKEKLHCSRRQASKAAPRPHPLDSNRFVGDLV